MSTDRIDVLAVMDRAILANSAGVFTASMYGFSGDAEKARKEHEDLNNARAAVAELIQKADNTLRAYDNLLTLVEETIPAGYQQYADDLRAALAKVQP